MIDEDIKIPLDIEIIDTRNAIVVYMNDLLELFFSYQLNNLLTSIMIGCNIQ